MSSASLRCWKFVQVHTYENKNSKIGFKFLQDTAQQRKIKKKKDKKKKVSNAF